VTKKILTYLMIVAMALLCAVSYQLFVFPNHFAPAGLNGLCTMIQYIFGVSIGYLNLLINVPLAIIVFFAVSKPQALRSMTYTLAFSVFTLILEKVDLSAFAYDTVNGSSTVLGPVVAGIITGFVSGMIFRTGANTGGTEFIASLIHKKNPQVNFFWVIFALNVSVAVVSYFVYDYQMEPVLLCVMYSFLSSTVRDRMSQNSRSAVRFEIVTDQPRELSDAIIFNLQHSSTLIPAKGMFSGKETNMLICVVNKSQVTELLNIIHEFPNSFVVMSQVSRVVGNFKKLDRRGNLQTSMLDEIEI
jgi:uncharacterized membrane-anchored protein YitT (DUF2179 family)